MLLFPLIAVVVVLYTHAHGREVMDTSSLCMECHSETKALTERESVHLPVKEGKCTACHNPHVSRHSGLLEDRDGRLCSRCHEPDKGFTGETVHEPVAEGKCLVCHDAHSSDYKGLLMDRGGRSCFKCHKEEEILAKENVHPEVKRHNCTVCHDPHSSGSVGLLVKDRTSLCSDCHYNPSNLSARACAYEAEGSDCVGCHSPHSSDRPALLKASLHKPFEEKNCAVCHGEDGTGKIVSRTDTDLCTECHNSVMASFNRINSHLIPGKDNLVCTNCHNPHASDVKHLMKDREERVCYSCHMDTKYYVANSNYTHPKLNRCTTCHTSHGSDNQFFLAAGGNTCSTAECHPTQGTFTHPIGEKIIDPRSRLPMTCSTCHNPMGSPEEFILRLEKDRELCIQCHQV